MRRIPTHSPHPYQFSHGTGQLPKDLQDCGGNMTPTCIKALYSIPSATRNDSVNSLGTYEEGDYYSQDDINLFFAQYAPNVL